jgi:protein gp37
MLSDYYSVMHGIEIATIEKRIQNKETISEREKLRILSAALRFISTSSFLGRIEAYLFIEDHNLN